MEKDKKNLLIALEGMFALDLEYKDLFSDDEYFFSIMEKLCTIYRDEYVKPYFGAFGKHLAPMKFDRSLPRKVTENNKTSYNSGETVAVYHSSYNTVTINIGRLININDGEVSYKGFTMENVLEMLSSIGHEYEHNFQYEGEEVAEQLAKDKEKFRAKINSITKKYAYELVDGSIKLNPLERDIRALLEITNSWDDFDTEDKNTTVKLCADAVYYNRYLEIDARAVEIKIFENFIEDAKKLTDDEKLLTGLDNALSLNKILDEIYTSTESNSSFGTVYNKYVDIIGKLSEKDYVEYAKTLTKAIDKEYYEKLKLHIEKGEPLPREGYVYGQFERDVLFDSFLFLGRKSPDKTKFSSYISCTRAINMRLAFLKFGVPIGDYLFSKIDILDSKKREEFLEKYFIMLKNGDISFNSFSRVEELPLEQQKELLHTYIERGQTEFVTSMLSEFERKDVEKLLTSELPPEHAPANNILDQIELKLCCMGLDWEQKKKDDKKTLKYDDIDDMITMLANMCQICGVPYDWETLDLSMCSKSISQEFSKKLHDLYVMAEEVGYDAVCQIDGRRPGPEAYRFAHAQDRKIYTLSGKDAQERQKDIYGLTAFYQNKWATQDFNDEQERSLQNNM